MFNILSCLTLEAWWSGRMGYSGIVLPVRDVYRGAPEILTILTPHIPIHILVKPWQHIRLLRRQRETGGAATSHSDREAGAPHRDCRGNGTAIPRHISPVRPHCALWAPETKSSCNTSTNSTNEENIDLPPELSLLWNRVRAKQYFISLLWRCQSIWGSRHFFLVLSKRSVSPEC